MALAIGRIDVDDMLQEIPNQLFEEWMAYYSLEPFGSLQGFVQAGIISSAIISNIPFRGKGAKHFSPLDFIPDFKMEFEEKRTLGVKSIAEKMNLLVNPNVTHEERRKKRVQGIKKRKRLLEKTKKEKEVKNNGR